MARLVVSSKRGLLQETLLSYNQSVVPASTACHLATGVGCNLTKLSGKLAERCHVSEGWFGNMSSWLCLDLPTVAVNEQDMQAQV